MVRMPAARWSGPAAIITAMVVQFGLATMPSWSAMA